MTYLRIWVENFYFWLKTPFLYPLTAALYPVLGHFPFLVTYLLYKTNVLYLDVRDQIHLNFQWVRDAFKKTRHTGSFRALGSIQSLITSLNSVFKHNKDVYRFIRPGVWDISTSQWPRSCISSSWTQNSCSPIFWRTIVVFQPHFLVMVCQLSRKMNLVVLFTTCCSQLCLLPQVCLHW